MSEGQRLDETEARRGASRAVDLDQARPAFDRIAFLVQCFAETPIAQVEVLDGAQIWRTGVSDAPIAAAGSETDFTRRAAAGHKVLWIEDAARERRTDAEGRAGGESAIRFYAGAPIRLASGEQIGAVSILDRKPRPFDGYLAARLEDFAAFVAEEWGRLEALQALRHADAQASALGRRITALMEAAPVALIMTDRDLRILRASPRWLEDRGLVGSDVVGRRLQDLLPAAHEANEAGFAAALAGETVRWDKLRLHLPNGERPWIRGETAPWREADGSIGGLLIMSQDVTDMVEALEALERSEQRLRMATDMAEVVVWEADYVHNRMKTFGQSIEYLKDMDIAQDVRHNLWQAVHPADQPAAIEQWQRHLDKGAPFRTTYRITQPDGPHMWVAAAAEAKWNENGELDRIVGVLKNIDREKRAEQAMTKALEVAEAANRAKTEFLANMSHEIRTPLNGVMGIASVLARTELTQQQRDMVDLIGVSAQTLEALLSDVLDLARIDSGRLDLRDEAFNLADALQSTAAIFDAKASDKGLALKTTISPAARTTVRGDAIRLRQIVSNLLSNAVKFTDQGKVSLHVEAEREEMALRMRLSVIDTGIGFDEETGKRLFQRFEQADGSITRRFGGTGLGLAISRSLAEAMGGSLSATSTPGKGAVFTLEVVLQCAEPVAETPRASAACAAAPADDVAEVVAKPATAACAPPPPMRVLLAEDHPTNRKVVGLILEGAGVDLTCVENGEEAVLAAERARYDLILMDVQMPVMDGLTAIHVIRLRETLMGRPRTPILALTANAMASDARASEMAGADGHLTKPIAAEKLISAVYDVREKVSEVADAHAAAGA